MIQQQTPAWLVIHLYDMGSANPEVTVTVHLDEKDAYREARKIAERKGVTFEGGWRADELLPDEDWDFPIDDDDDDFDDDELVRVEGIFLPGRLVKE